MENRRAERAEAAPGAAMSQIDEGPVEERDTDDPDGGRRSNRVEASNGPSR